MCVCVCVCVCVVCSCMVYDAVICNINSLAVTIHYAGLMGTAIGNLDNGSIGAEMRRRQIIDNWVFLHKNGVFCWF